MGCFGYIILVLGTGWMINNEWIIRNTDMNLWLAVFLVVLFVGIADLLLLGFKLLVQLLALPVSFLTVGWAWRIINWVFKYFSLLLVCSVTGWFTLPWIFGPHWWQALIISIVLSVLTSASSSSSSSKKSS